jgi:hypothetical protein
VQLSRKLDVIRASIGKRHAGVLPAAVLRHRNATGFNRSTIQDHRASSIRRERLIHRADERTIVGKSAAGASRTN